MRTLCRSALFLIALCALPFAAHADVIINEIAWMGTDEGGANCEWVELRNESADVVSLSGWTLTVENAGTGAPKVLDLGDPASVKFSGIAGNGYYLIARNTGSCVDLSPGTSADWLGSFGTGISNTGAKLILKNGTEEEDTVDSKSSWEAGKGGIGGTNVSGKAKETPQRSGTAWLTAAPTPRGPNQSPPLEELPDPDENDSGTTTPVVTIGGTAPLVPVNDPVPKIYIDAGPTSRIVASDAQALYHATVYDSTGKLRRDAVVTWAFGDGGHKKGADTEYAYREPGEYTAVVRAKTRSGSAVELLTIVVEAPKLEVSEPTESGITLTNHGEHLLDLSNWEVQTNKRTFTLPQDTVLPAGKSVVLTWEVMGMGSSSDIALLYPDTKVAVAYDAVSDKAVDEQLSTPTPGLVEVPEPPASYAVTRTSYADDPAAPADASLTAAPVGAALKDKKEGAAPTGTPVILKGDTPSMMQGVASFFGGLMASVAGFAGH